VSNDICVYLRNQIDFTVGMLAFMETGVMHTFQRNLRFIVIELEV